MKILNYFFNTLTSENYFINLFLGVLFIGLSLLFFEKITKTNYSKKIKIIYLFVNTTLFILGYLLKNITLSLILFLISSIILFTILQKVSKIFTFIYFSIEAIIMLNIHFIVFKFLCIILNFKSYSEMIALPIFGILSIILSSIFGLIIYHLFKKLKFEDTYIISLEEKSNIIITFSVINMVIVSLIQYNFFEIFIQNLYNTILLDIYFYLVISNIMHSCNKFATKKKIENLKLYNTTMSTMYDDTRAFKHDFHNIIQAIGGYIAINDMEGLKKYYKQISNECQMVNCLSKLNFDLINNPAIYNILVDKYYKASNLNIQLNLDVLIDFSKLYVKIYDFTRILGILLDNAIEASKECKDKKKINISFNQSDKKQVLIIENTYNNKDISVEKIFEKNYSTKPNNTGLGLWEVKRILNRNSNLNLLTIKNDKYFSQKLEIYTA